MVEKYVTITLVPESIKIFILKTVESKYNVLGSPGEFKQ